jgi:hypothetical protein
MQRSTENYGVHTQRDFLRNTDYNFFLYSCTDALYTYRGSKITVYSYSEDGPILYCNYMYGNNFFLIYVNPNKDGLLETYVSDGKNQIIHLDAEVNLSQAISKTV